MEKTIRTIGSRKKEFLTFEIYQKTLGIFWSYLAGFLGSEAVNLDKLKARILNCFKKVDQECVYKLAEGTQRRIDTIRRYDPVEMR